MMRAVFRTIGIAVACALAFSSALTQTAMADTLPAALTQPNFEQQNASAPSAQSSPNAPSGSDPKDGKTGSTGNPNGNANNTTADTANHLGTSPSTASTSPAQPDSKPKTDASKTDTASKAEASDVDKTSADGQKQEKQKDSAKDVITPTLSLPQEDPSPQPTVGPQDSCGATAPASWGTATWYIDSGCTLHISGGASPDIRPTDDADEANIPWVRNNTYRGEITKVCIEGNLSVIATKKPRFSNFGGYYTGLFASMNRLIQFSLAPGATLSLNGLAASFMFYFSTNIVSLDLSHVNTSNATNMNSMFYKMSKLKSLDLSNFDTSKVNDLSYMLYDCDALTSLVLGSKTKIDSYVCLRNVFWTRMYGSPNPARTGISTSQLYTETQQGRAQGTYVVNGTLGSGPYTLKFNLNGGSGTAPQDLPGTTGSRVTLPQFTGISRNGYAATSWNTQPDGNGIDYQAGSTLYPVAGTTTFYVKWKDTTVPVIDMQGKMSFLINTPIYGLVYKNQGGPVEQGVTVKAVWSDGRPASSVTTDSDGKWSIENTGHAVGTTVTITATDSDGNVGDPVTVNITDHIVQPPISSLPLTGGHGQDFPAGLIVFGIIGACVTSVFLNRSRYRNR